MHYDLNKSGPAQAGLLREQQPIAALSSGHGQAGVAMIRASGAGVLNLVQKAVRAKQAWPFPPRQMTRAAWIDPVSQEVIDDVMLAVFVAPASYTGQDTVEIFCHGGPFIISRILETLYALGCRPAEPGEFTKRAFLHGKLDLTRAEGIHELIQAQSEQEWRAGRLLASGKLAQHVDSLRSELIKAMAYLEAMIDFPDEEDTKTVALKQVQDLVRAVESRMERMVDTSQSGQIAAQGLRVAIIGEPNAGKSTLLNTLLRSERAIVTAVAGTTRDYIEEACLIKGRLIRLVDTAGIREASDLVEQAGIQRSRQLAQDADVVIWLCPADASAPRPQTVAGIDSQKILPVVSKVDMGVPSWATSGWTRISCQDQLGLSELEAALAQKVESFLHLLSDDVYVTNHRQKFALEQALAAIKRFFVALAAGEYEECLAFELQESARALVQIVGRIDQEDLLDRIFSDFCVGK